MSHKLMNLIRNGLATFLVDFPLDANDCGNALVIGIRTVKKRFFLIRTASQLNRWL